MQFLLTIEVMQYFFTLFKKLETVVAGLNERQQLLETLNSWKNTQI